MSNVMDGLLYTEKHEWVKEEGDLLVMGLSDFAQHSLGDIVFVDIQPTGTTLNPDDSYAAVESVKAAEDVYTPTSGTIAEVNQALSDSPELVNQDPYANWLVKLKDYDKDKLRGLMDAAAYREYIAGLED